MKSLLLSFTLLFTIISLHAQQPGTLDPTFGTKGTYIDPSPTNIAGETMKVTKDGRILIGTGGPYKGFAFTFKIEGLTLKK